MMSVQCTVYGVRRLTPPEKEAFLYLLIKQRRLVFIHLAEDCPHECLTDEAAFIFYAVLRAEPVECLLLAVVEEDGNSMFAWGLHERLEIERKFGTEREEVSALFPLKTHSLYRLFSQDLRLLELRKEHRSDSSLWVNLASIAQIHSGV